jgi:hypothetical protein
MKKRFVFSLGLTLGFCIGATHAIEKMMSVDEIRKACANRVANKISDFLYGKCHCSYSYDWRFATQEDCENAWHDICEIIQLYGQITVAEVKKIAGVQSSSYEDTKRGWTGTIGMSLRPEKDGAWTIHLPESKRLPRRSY